MSADPKTPLDEAREALAALDEFTTALDEARDAAYREYWTSKIDNADERDAYKRAKAENDERFMLERDQARRERDEARQQLAEERARVAPVADTGDCRTCKWADTVVCHNPEGKRKNSPVWTWCAHALAEDLMTRLGTSPPCPGYTRKES